MNICRLSFSLLIPLSFLSFIIAIYHFSFLSVVVFHYGFIIAFPSYSFLWFHYFCFLFHWLIPWHCVITTSLIGFNMLLIDYWDYWSSRHYAAFSLFFFSVYFLHAIIMYITLSSLICYFYFIDFISLMYYLLRHCLFYWLLLLIIISCHYAIFVFIYLFFSHYLFSLITLRYIYYWSLINIVIVELLIFWCH